MDSIYLKLSKTYFKCLRDNTLLISSGNLFHIVRWVIYLNSVHIKHVTKEQYIGKHSKNTVKTGIQTLTRRFPVQYSNNNTVLYSLHQRCGGACYIKSSF